MPSTDLGMWAAIAAVALAMMVQIVAVAFFFGRLFERQNSQHQRIKKLEESDGIESGSSGALTLAVARLEVDLKHVVNDVADIKTRFAWLRPAGEHGGL